MYVDTTIPFIFTPAAQEVKEDLTRQDIFDVVVNHYRANPFQSTDINRHCRYRYGSKKCFAGVLIPDSLYEPSMDEGHSAHSLAHCYPMPDWFKNNIELIQSLQSIHDCETNWSMGIMEMVLSAFAHDNSLNYEPPAQ
jgi:hypothetical protein